MTKQQCCEQYCNLDIGESNKFFRMTNGMWEGSGSCVWIDKANKKLGWSWNNTGGWIYPEVAVGSPQNNWGSGTWPNTIPLQYKNINTLTAEIGFTYTQPPTGWYNLSFDIYWCPSTTGYQRKYNIMIWFQGELGNWNGETVNDGINDYTVHIYDKGWPYVAFILKNQIPGTTYYKVNIKSLMDKIKSSWHDVAIDGNWYVPALEFGSESYLNGDSGAIEINKLNIEINGNVISLSGDITPTVTPTVIPTVTPTVTPTISPTITPIITPTVTPTITPTITPTVTPPPGGDNTGILILGALAIGAIIFYIKKMRK